MMSFRFISSSAHPLPSQVVCKKPHPSAHESPDQTPRQADRKKTFSNRPSHHMPRRQVAAPSLLRRPASETLPLFMQRLLPWCPLAHPGPWDRRVDARQEHSVYHELLAYVEALRPPPSLRWWGCMRWQRRTQSQLRQYINRESRLQKDSRSPHWRQETKKCLRQLYCSLHQFEHVYAGHPRFHDINALVKPACYGLRQRATELGITS